MIPGSVNPLLLAADAAAPTGYQIQRSLRFNSSDSAFCSRVFSSAGNRKTFTYSAWVKRNKLGVYGRLLAAGTGTSDATYFALNFRNSDIISVEGVGTSWRLTTQVFRDPGAWMHVLLAIDTTLAVAGDRIKLYINGSQVTTFSASNDPTQNYDFVVNSNVEHMLGADKYNNSYSYYSDFQLADVHFIDGQALTPSSFTEVSATTGQLIPKKYTGTFTGNSFWLQFADNSSNTATTLGKDSSGLGNNWTPFNLQTTTGGPTSVAAASGALPIYNTTDTYGTTKGTGTRTDVNASSLVLAIPMDGANNGTTFTDESATIKGSGSAKTLTRTGFITSTTRNKFYGSSGYSDTNYNSITVSSSTDFDFGTGDFTIECWIYPETITTYGWIFGTAGSNTTGTVYLALKPIGTALFETYTGSSRPNVTKSGVVTNAWNHIAAIRSGNTWTIYVNGIAGTPATITQSLTSTTPRIGSNSDESGNSRFNGYIQDLRVYKGISKYTANFNPPSTTQNATVAAGNDSLVDVPTNGSQTDTGVGGEVRGNYCTWNPLAKLPKPADLSNGNLDYSASGTSLQVIGTIGVASGKWYWEVENPGGYWAVGVAKAFGWSDPGNFQYTDFWGVEWSGNKVSPPNVRTAYGYSGAIVGVAFDADAGTLRFYGDGVDKGIAFTGLTNGPYFPAAATYNGTDTANFGQRPFAYTAPSGFKALNTANLPAPVVTKPSTVMDVALYTGNNTARSITGLGFSPDFVWIKGRSGATDHALYDIVRGVQTDLVSNSTAAETTQSTGLTAFNSDGFSIGTLAKLNTNSATYAGWCWDAGSTTVTNTQGSITSQVRTNNYLSIVTYTGNGVGGATVGHGLGVAPGFFVCKRRDSTGSWYACHSALGGNFGLSLNATDAATSSPNYWNNTNPTSSVITLSSIASPEINGNGGKYLIYAFAPVGGLSAFGSYTGNGSADGPFVFLGFRPAVVMVKMSSSTGNWTILDDKREGYNVDNDPLYPNLNNAEGTTDLIDITSNGFKVRTTDATFNTNTGTYVYAAWASSPFQYARAR